ncbi:MAG: methyltransferase, partial [Actinomycetota bacterium]|nr:methyltransferase [Actinomycetota bacterium]
MLPLFQQKALPVLQNRTFPSEREARTGPVGDICLEQDPDFGFVFNASFFPELVHYDHTYSNEQA